MRDSKPRRMIQQQLYARERRGIFRSTEGYDTIAKSNGLEPAFIKKVLHPFCVYDAPAELSTRGEKDGAAYPETMHLLHLDNGDILLGRSVYQAADFTGLRSAFFTHNYVIPSGHEDESVSPYESWLRASFTDSYDIDKGTEIAELAHLPLERAAVVRPSYRSILALLNIGEKAFKQLLYAVMAAVGGKKKIYVSLDVPIAQLPDKAKQLLMVLYASLPYAYRKQLGFITYAKEPQSRKSVHLTFVEQGSLRPGDRSIEKDFTFDFVSGRIMNVDLDGAEQPYLDFAWDMLERPDRAESFFQFAQLMLADMGAERQTAASSYHELCIIYQIEEGNESLYEAHKSAVLRGLLDYLEPSGSIDSKIRLNDILLSRFDYEFDRVRQGAVPEAFIVDVFKEYYRIDGKNLEGKMISFFISALNNANKQNDQEAAAALYAAIESSPNLSKAFFKSLLAGSRLADTLLLPFLEKKLQAVSGAKSVLQLIEEWGSVHPKLLGYAPFHTLARQQLQGKLERERYSLPAVSRAFEQLRRLDGIEKQRSSDEAGDLYRELELAVYRTTLAELELSRITKDQLASADFLSHKDRLQRWNGKLQDPRQSSAAVMLLALYEWFVQPKPSASLFDRLSPPEIDLVQLAGRGLLEGQLDRADFPQLMLAFLRSTDTETVDYVGLLDYLHRHAPNKEMIYQFFQWSEQQSEFMRPRGFVPAYSSAIVSYFVKYDRDAFKKRANRKQHFDKGGAFLKAVYKQAERELSSGNPLLFFRNSKAKMITTIAGLGVVLIVAGFIYSNANKGDEGKEGAILPGVQPTAEANMTGPDTLVYAELQPEIEGQEATTSLVFLFKDAAACEQFAPSSLTIESAGIEKVEYTKLMLASNCSTDTANGSVTDAPSGEWSQQPSESTEPSASLPAATPVSDAEYGTAASSDSGASGSSSATTNPNAPESDSDSGSQAETSPLPDIGSNEANELNGYGSRVEVNLGKQVDIPADSIIRIGEEEYKLTVLSVVDKS
ncbi:hypothetical protein BK133_08470 [Paenibacillus sp. FSL H8-0548]|uniref:GAP1-N2 domain-containing protein n=1 Tax=Paenibacillus sp. FSL H8-0548 TaxID=1920422 RepID=UPI00096EF907|nr:hypothetical protein [Paenibacillus sp. FSL H8-0548]OMF36937.1 hypothetical protein BK133_08470 [Paenibacillus sp. FSL H8-0548]